MKKVIFICRGNMFRSQIATALYNHLVRNGSRAEGYGTAVERDGREGRSLSSFPGITLELEFMKERGMDITNQSCKQVTQDALKNADMIIMMSEREFIPDWLSSNYKYTFWELPNPHSLTPEIVERVYGLLHNKISALLKA